MGSINVNTISLQNEIKFEAKKIHMFDHKIISWSPAGDYSHSYVIGTDITNGKDVLGNCVVVRYREEYMLECTECSYTIGPYTETTETHGSCKNKIIEDIIN